MKFIIGGIACAVSVFCSVAFVITCVMHALELIREYGLPTVQVGAVIGAVGGAFIAFVAANWAD